MSQKTFVTFLVFVTIGIIVCTSALTCYNCDEKREHITGTQTGNCSDGRTVVCPPTVTNCIFSVINSKKHQVFVEKHGNIDHFALRTRGHPAVNITYLKFS